MKKIIQEKSHMISKLFIYQIAMSLLGVFIVTPFTKNAWCMAAGIFSLLFYLSLVSYAVVEDGQKDFVSHSAGRINGKSTTGLKYSLISYIPTIALVCLYAILKLCTTGNMLSALKNILNIIIRFFLMGSFLGIDVGITGYGYDAATQSMVSAASVVLRFISDNGIFFVICLFVVPVVSGLMYSLAFKGKININTHKKEK